MLQFLYFSPFFQVFLNFSEDFVFKNLPQILLKFLSNTFVLSFQLASQESQNPLFPGFGIRKINMHDLRPVPYQNNLHKKEIRDMAFSYHDRNSLLTVSLDGTAKLFDIQSNVAVQNLDGNVFLLFYIDVYSQQWPSTEFSLNHSICTLHFLHNFLQICIKFTIFLSNIFRIFLKVP